MFLNNMFQKFDHLPPSGKNPSPVDSPSIFYCLHQRLIPPLSNNFHVISQTSFIFSCSHCSCTIFISPSYSLHTQAMLIFLIMPVLINVHYLQLVVFSSEKGLNGQKHSSSDSHQPIKQSSSPSKIYHSSPTPYSNAI